MPGRAPLDAVTGDLREVKSAGDYPRGARGPAALTTEQKARLLGDPSALSWVHSNLWLNGADATPAPHADEARDESDSARSGYAAAA